MVMVRRMAHPTASSPPQPPPPPAAQQSTGSHSGDRHQQTSPLKTPVSSTPRPGTEVALDFLYFSSPESAAGSEQEEEDRERTRSTAEKNSSRRNVGDAEEQRVPKQRLQSILVIPPRRISYRDAVAKPVFAEKRSLPEERASRHQEKTQQRSREEEWKEVKAKYWWRRSRPPIKQGGMRPVKGRQRTASQNKFWEWFRIRLAGKCFKCFARDHKAVDCRDPPKCILCFRSGHKARNCQAHLKQQAATGSPQPLFLPTRSTTTHAAASRIEPKPIQKQKQRTEKKAEQLRMDCDIRPGAPHLRPGRVVACARKSEGRFAYTWYLGVVDGTSPRQPRRKPVHDRLESPGGRRRGRSLRGDGWPGKRGRGNEGRRFGAEVALMEAGQSSRQWQMRPQHGEGSLSRRWLPAACPPATGMLGGQTAATTRGPKDGPHSMQSYPEFAFMEAQLASEPLEEKSLQWDPMVQEFESSQAARSKSVQEDSQEDIDGSQMLSRKDHGPHMRENDGSQEEAQRKAMEDQNGPTLQNGPNLQQPREQGVEAGEHDSDMRGSEQLELTGIKTRDHDVHQNREERKEQKEAIELNTSTEAEEMITGRDSAAETDRREPLNEGEGQAAILPFTASVTKKIVEPILKAPNKKTATKKKTTVATKAATDTPRRSSRIAKKATGNKTMEQQATELLMKRIGTLPPQKEVNDEAHEMFGEQFVTPLSRKKITGFREIFGMEEGMKDCFSMLISQARAEEQEEEA